LRDYAEAEAVGVEGEDASHDRGSDGVRLKAMQALPGGRLGWVGVRPGVGEAIPIGRPSAEVAVGLRGQRLHGGADAEFDAGALPLGQPTEQGHHEVMGFGPGVDGATHLRDPQADPVEGEHRVGQGELAAVEGAGWFADYDRLPAAVGVGEIGEQPGCFGSSFPRQ